MSIVQRAGCSGLRQSLRAVSGRRDDADSSGAEAGGGDVSSEGEGNRFVQSMAVQAKLLVGPADDEYEKEADWLADQVMSMVGPRVQQTCLSCNEEDAVQRASLFGQITPLVQRQAAPEEEEEIQTKSLFARITPRAQMAAAPEEEEEIQTKSLFARITPRVQTAAAPEEEEEVQTKPLVPSAGAKGGLAEPDLEQSLAQARGNGSPLADDVRGRMENAFGVDFSTVRIHSDEQADSLSRCIQARAFTVGRDIFLRQNEYQPENYEGQWLLAHELSHTLQQRGVVRPSQVIMQKNGKKGKQKHTGSRSSVPKFLTEFLRQLCANPRAATVFNNSEGFLPKAKKGEEYREADAGTDRQGGRGQYRVLVLIDNQGEVLGKYYSVTHYGTGKNARTGKLDFVKVE